MKEMVTLIMVDLEAVCFQIITNVGAARSSFVMAIVAAKEGKFDEADRLMEEGGEHFAKGHEEHLTLFASEVPKEFSAEHILLIHAEDQLMSSESFKILATEFIDLYRRLDKGQI
ncbi:MAG: PTS lactose/cellobiose transporter subunit IIA [Bacillota bacterium]